MQGFTRSMVNENTPVLSILIQQTIDFIRENLSRFKKSVEEENKILYFALDSSNIIKEIEQVNNM